MRTLCHCASVGRACAAFRDHTMNFITESVYVAFANGEIVGAEVRGGGRRWRWSGGGGNNEQLRVCEVCASWTAAVVILVGRRMGALGQWVGQSMGKKGG